MTVFAALDSLIIASVLELYGQSESVGNVADVVAWPLGILGLQAFAASIGQKRDRG